MRTRDSSHESGSALLELAFSLPLFVLLILGSAEIANMAWASVQLNNAAHAGAQFGSLSRANAADMTDIEAAAQNEAPSLTVTFPAAPVLACSCVTAPTGVQTAYSCSSVQSNCPSPNVILASIQVTTAAVVRPLVHYPGFPASYTMHAQATMGIVK